MRLRIYFTRTKGRGVSRVLKVWLPNNQQKLWVQPFTLVHGTEGLWKSIQGLPCPKIFFCGSWVLKSNIPCLYQHYNLSHYSLNRNSLDILEFQWQDGKPDFLKVSGALWRMR